MPDIICPMLEKAVSEKVFDGVTHGHITVSLYRDKEPVFSATLDAELVNAYQEELEQSLNRLESSMDWAADETLLTETITAYMTGKADPDRALTIVLRYLYSGEETSEDVALKLLQKYQDTFPRWRYEYALYEWENFDFTWAVRRMTALAESYEPA